VSWDQVPGYVGERDGYGETTVVVEPERLVEAATYLRDEEGFLFLADVSATDYLGWGSKGVAGYIGTASGRDLNRPGSQGLQTLPEIKPWRRASASRSGSTTASRCRASSRCGRPPTGTSARPTT
jgi:hypothetical protein